MVVVNDILFDIVVWYVCDIKGLGLGDFIESICFSVVIFFVNLFERF